MGTRGQSTNFGLWQNLAGLLLGSVVVDLSGLWVSTGDFCEFGTDNFVWHGTRAS